MSQEDFIAARYTFRNESQTTQIVYYPQAPGPLTPDSGPGPRVDFHGEGGNLTFHGDQVETLQSPLGQLITVTLKPSIDAGALTLTVLVPPVNLAGQEAQMFETLGIETRSYGILPHTGARLTYAVLHLDGLAENIILPLVAEA